MWLHKCKLTILTYHRGKTPPKHWEQCGRYVYFDEHRCPVLWRVTDRHITLSGRETNGILPHLAATAAAASTIISSLIMSNKATQRQTAPPSHLHTFLRNRSPDTLLSEEIRKKQSEACSFSLCVLSWEAEKRGTEGLESSSSIQKQKEEHSAPFALWL